ncbi:penicillin-binding protein 1A, partial [candidate division KSB1 bacterium]
IISSEGEVIKEIHKGEKRILVPLKDIPENMINAIIATEDQRFFRHWGVDTYRVFGAAFEVIKSFSYKEGFSTITMQLTRQLHFNPEKKIVRKLREVLAAIQIEKRFSKNEILEMYLNNSYFGHGAYGIQRASQIFFEKDVGDLELDECALLTAVLKAQFAYSPVIYPEKALSRRNLVLRNMQRIGYISPTQRQEAAAKPIDVKYQLRTEAVEPLGPAPYFDAHVQTILKEMEKSYGFDMFRDGLKVYTTLNLTAQALADSAMQNQLKKQQVTSNIRYGRRDNRKSILDKKGYDPVKIPELLDDQAFMDSLLTVENVVQGAIMAMDLNTGHVLALIGGKDFNNYQFNRATQAVRQPGSAFKPFVYTVAVDNGYPLTTRLLDQNIPGITDYGVRWNPGNYDNSLGGLLTLREGFKRSRNLISIRVIKELKVSPKEVALVAKTMGITTPIAEVDAIPLGVSAVKPIEIISAFSAFPNQGMKVDPVFITRIVDQYGDIIYENPGTVKHEVLSPQTAYLMTDMLKEVVQTGTGYLSHTNYGYDGNRPAGGKTGTTQDHTEAWFIGFTKQIVAGVWIGYDSPTLSLGPNQSGAIVALPVWSEFMQDVHDTLGLPQLDFDMPEGIVELEICSETKQLAGRYCPRKEKELFNERFKPDKVCEKHAIKRRY